ncbi:MAG: hypothetical protein C0597_17395 [Marinilabiliales bacterium]|nr:MAG: hypothetical protein C0597_17395 [Marinilabiliales bacterium]
MNEIKNIGIIGSGKMGSDLFNYLSDFNFHLIWFTRNIEHQESLKKTFRKKIKRQLKHGIISQEVFDLKNKYRITNTLNDFADCHLIIESVPELLEIKVEIFKTLENIIKPACVLASNSSSILPSEISTDLKSNNRFIGLHFFYPIAFKNIIEVISSDFTDDLTIEKSKLFLDEIKRFYIIQDERNAFILNRFLLQIQIKAYELMKKYELNFMQLDRIAKEMIPEFGLFEMMDHVGHHTMHSAIMNYSRMDSDKSKYQALLNELQKRKSNSENNLFYNLEKEIGEVSKDKKKIILDELEQIVKIYLQFYLEEYQINLYTLKKGLEEFCGLNL